MYHAILTSWKENTEEKQFIEIWNQENRVHNLNLTKLNKHSKIYENSSSLGAFEWSSDSKQIAYVAEIKKNDTEKCFFTSKIASTNDAAQQNESSDFLNELNYEKVN
jgi:hypothetical protein